MSWLLRLVFMSARFARTNQAGFVLPTTVMLLLVFSLTVGGLSYRSFSRVEQTIAQREQKLVSEFATPAIDRAKAKIEYVFKESTELAEKTVPTDTELLATLLKSAGTGDDLYTFPDETQLDIVNGSLFVDQTYTIPEAVGNDEDLDPAWSFTIGEGTDDEQTIVYSISLKGTSDETEADGSRDNKFNEGTTDLSLTSRVNDAKAQAMVVRNAPISTTGLGKNCPIGTVAESGWQEVGPTQLEKTFQVNILSIKYPNGDELANPIVNAAEYQQVRVAPKGLKWGAWFRYDLDIFPGPNLRWNGAMHTEGNLFVERSFKAYLTSAPGSCINSPLASEISLNAVDNSNPPQNENDPNRFDDPEDFVGQVAGASIIQNTFQLRDGAGGIDDDVIFHRYDFNGNIPREVEFGAKGNPNDTENDSTKALANQTPTAIAIDPVVILTEDGYQHLEEGPYIVGNWDDANATPNPLKKPDGNADRGRVELFQDTDNRPFLDDGFRADNRYGPKPVYDSQQSLRQKDGVDFATPKRVGDLIVDHDALVSNNVEAEEFGLDGYWERRSKLTGMRAIVGQRLELGTPFGWVADDPLYPPNVDAEAHEDKNGNVYKGEAEVLQQRTLRDNLAAVQSLVVYHYTQGVDGGRAGDLPYMCMASTAHPGTEETLVNSRTFGTFPSGSPQVDFLTGNGTNGWEFDFYANFSTQVVDTAPLGQALRNLAHFAGDPYGGAPSFPPAQGTEGIAYDGTNANTAELVHPYPYLSMWGDFSTLRRVIYDYNPATGVETDKLTSAVAYNNLSPADKSTLHTAACSLGMLAYSLKENTAEADQIRRDRAYGFRPQDVNGVVDPKYPALYYLFPAIDHNHLGIDSTVGGTPNPDTGEVDHTQPVGEEYFSEDGVATPYIAGANGVNRDPGGGAFLYKAVALDDIDLTPKANVAAFEQPTDTPAGATLAIGDANREDRTKSYIIDPAGTVRELTFLDKVMMDGRELMAVRTLDLDLDKLTANTVGGAAWIPEADGLIYVFREDAVREDSIVRPRHNAAEWDTGGGDDCKIFANLAGLTAAANANCRMTIDAINGSGEGTYDPPLSTDSGISPKPVDMAPDPMRRPYGFRLINGDDLNRSTDLESAGMTFVSDNPVYIKGNLNFHKLRGSDPPEFLEEFEIPAGGVPFTVAFADEADEDDAKALFYNRTDLDGRFASPEDDAWRPVEIFADAVAILSDTFLDGEIEDAFLVRNSGNPGAPDQNSSFLNAHRPCPDNGANACKQLQDRWQREDGVVVNNMTLGNPVYPVYVDRNGAFRNDTQGGGVEFEIFPNGLTDQAQNDDLYIWRGINKYDEVRYADLMEADRGQVADEDQTRVNALLISGVHPSRPGQTYGGLHNFPRMLEYWEDKPLFISGGMFQLNFSTQATGTFDQDAWEPGALPLLTRQDNKYYFPPDRYWGYDVALQYRFAAPIGQRFQSVGEPRNEYYRDLPLNDEYIKTLMCGVDQNGNYIELNKRLKQPDGSDVTDAASCKAAVEDL